MEVRAGCITFVLLMKKVTVHLIGPIVAEASAEMARMFGVVSLATVKAEVEAVPDATEIEVLVHSPGGSVFEGWAIHNYLRSLKKPIATKIVGECYSIATVPFLAGDTREIAENGSLGIHNPWLNPEDLGPMEADDLIKLGSEIKAEEIKMLDFYVERTGGDKAKIESLMKQDTRLDAETAKSLGFVTKIAEAYNTQSRVKNTKILALLKTDSMSKTAKPTAAENILAEFKALKGEIVAALKGEKPAGAAGAQAKSFTVKTTDGDEITIDAAGDTPAVGDMVMKGGAAHMDASFTIADGGDLAGYVCKTGPDGKITEITAPAAADTDSEETKALKAENEVLKAALAEMMSEVKEIKSQIVSTHKPAGGTGTASSRAAAIEAARLADEEKNNPFKKAASNVSAKHKKTE